MTHFVTNSTTAMLDHLDWEPFSEIGIDLTAEQLEQATQFAQPVANPDQQWQIYLHRLALFGFEEWMSERSPDLTLNLANCVLLQPQIARLLGSVCNLQIGEFKVGLIATGSLADTVVPIPRAMIDLSAYTAHFYVLVEVLEEQGQVKIQGYLRADQFSAYQQSHPLVASVDHTYACPIDWFGLDADNLLLNLRCLEPAAIPLSSTVHDSVLTDSVQQSLIQQKLTAIKARSVEYSFSQQLTWEEVVTVLAYPEWLNQSTQVSTDSVQLIQREIDSNFPQSTANNILNVATWFQGRLDSVAQQLAWVLLPPAIESVALRSTVAEWDLLLANLTQNGLLIPETAACAYRDLDWEEKALRLHAITWEMQEFAEPEWVLLLILGGQPHTRLPVGSKLQVRDERQMLVEQELADADRMYLYAQIVGHQDEQFWVSIGSNTSMLTLSPFAFRLQDA